MQRVQDWLIGVSLFVLLMWSAAVARGNDDFTTALNNQRAALGLPMVTQASNGSSVVNNAQQRVRGLGHFYTGGIAQCAAVGACNADQALRMWAGSPAHAALIFSPSLTAVGFACDGWAASVACTFGPIPVVAKTPLSCLNPNCDIGPETVKQPGTTQPVPLTTSVVARPAMLNCRIYGTGWCGQKRFRLFRRIR